MKIKKHADKLLGESEEKLHAITCNALDSIFCKDINRKYTFVNPAMVKLLGCRESDLLGKIPEEIFDEEAASIIYEVDTRALSGENVSEVRSLTIAGKSYVFHTIQVPLRDFDGKVQGLSGIVRDVSHHKKEEERYRQIIESSIDGFWIIDSKGKFLDVNQAYCSMIGYGRNEVLNMSIMDIEVDMSPEEIGNKIEKVIEEGYGRFETRHRHKNGNIIDVEISTSYSRGSDQEFFVFLRDITERNRSEEENRKLEIQLQQSQKLQSIGTLAGGIAHDFNNILCPIIGFTEMSIQDLPENHPIKENLEDILIGANRARDLVKQILSFSCQKKSLLEPILLQPIIIESLKLLRSSIPSNIEIIKKIYTGTDYIFADSTEIHEIIMNLCTNAYHSMEDTGGTLKISLSKIESDSNLNLSSKEYCCLGISDTGIGIPPEVTIPPAKPEACIVNRSKRS